jgi:predicted  nucleic acid-binding Zn-ribbon protein
MNGIATITGTIFFVLQQNKIKNNIQTNEINNELKAIKSSLSLLLHRVSKIEEDIIELNETLEFFDEKISEKDNFMRKSSEILSNKVDKYIISNYEEITL